jgi:pSer/pThr/pTyr-binding forkhead associated (FHA) protein
VLDQMSANGTYVNGKRSNVSYLTSGDRVRFGPVECVFQTSRAAAAPRRTTAAEPASKPKTLTIAAIAFVATIVVLFLVYKFVL